MLAIIYILVLVSIVVAMLPTKVKKSIGKFAVAAVAVAAISIIFGGVLYGALAEEIPEGYYPRVTVVVDLNYDEDVVIVEDSVGLTWEFYGIEDYDIGDTVAIILWDNGTPNTIFDDIVVAANYSGFRIIREEV